MPKLIVYPMVMCPRDKVSTDVYGCKEACEHFGSWDVREFFCEFQSPNNSRKDKND